MLSIGISAVQRAQRIAGHLKEAHELRRIAAFLSLRQARAVVLQAAIEHEQRAASLVIGTI